MEVYLLPLAQVRALGIDLEDYEDEPDDAILVVVSQKGIPSVPEEARLKPPNEEEGEA